MEKDENIDIDKQDPQLNEDTSEKEEKNAEQNTSDKPDENTKELTPEEKIRELEDKLARTFAEMENQRRRFEKEREDAFSYGGFAFAKETLNLIDNFERSKKF